jgi:ankyrin repeat protein
MVTYFLENETVVIQKNINNWTPMHFASRNGLVHIVTVLIQHKADVNCVTKNGITPLMLACDHEHKHVVEVLL